MPQPADPPFNMDSEASTPDPPEEFELLDGFVGGLHRQERPSRRDVLAKQPELDSILECLEGLERLAPPVDVSWDDLPDATLSDGPILPRTTPGPGRFGDYELLEELGRG